MQKKKEKNREVIDNNLIEQWHGGCTEGSYGNEIHQWEKYMKTDIDMLVMRVTWQNEVKIKKMYLFVICSSIDYSFQI